VLREAMRCHQEATASAKASEPPTMHRCVGFIRRRLTALEKALVVEARNGM
jgi:hypothetical protein